MMLVTVVLLIVLAILCTVPVVTHDKENSNKERK